MDIIGKKNWYFALSLLVIIPGLIFFILNYRQFGFGLNLGIDFIGGTRVEYKLPGESENGIKSFFESKKVEVYTIQNSGENFTIRTRSINPAIYKSIKNKILSSVKNSKELSYEDIGPIIGSETSLNALKALVLASILIVIYITWSFRTVPKPASSFRFGICAIIALIHDVLVVVGSFAILGYFLKVEVDSLFVTALLTVIGFSVHDTIVVFDRIRENLIKHGSQNFANVVNESIHQTLVRSLRTSLTVILVLFSLLLFGGESIRWFIVALLIGIISGTYSSIFNASPLLVLWQELSNK